MGLALLAKSSLLVVATAVGLALVVRLLLGATHERLATSRHTPGTDARSSASWCQDGTTRSCGRTSASRWWRTYDPITGFRVVARSRLSHGGRLSALRAVLLESALQLGVEPLGRVLHDTVGRRRVQRCEGDGALSAVVVRADDARLLARDRSDAGHLRGRRGDADRVHAATHALVGARLGGWTDAVGDAGARHDGSALHFREILLRSDGAGTAHRAGGLGPRPR